MAKTRVPIINVMAILDSECSTLEQRINGLCATELKLRYSDAADKEIKLEHLTHVIEVLNGRLDEAYVIRKRVRRMIIDIGGTVKW